jgi:hypothetical protein
MAWNYLSAQRLAFPQNIFCCMQITVFWDVKPCSMIEVSEVLAASIIRALLMETINNSNMAVNFYVT